MQWDAAAVGEFGGSETPWNVRHVAVTGSTSTDLLAAARNGAAEGEVLVADHQTHGRGRGDRRWVDRRHSDLLFSLLLRPPIPAEQYGVLSLATGIAVVGALTELTGVECGLKWPNDVIAPSRTPASRHAKIAGILLEVNTEARYAVIGIGINLRGSAPELDAGLPALSVEQATGAVLRREIVLTSVLRHLDSGYRQLREAGADSIIAVYERLDALYGRPVRVRMHCETVEGTAAGIDTRGRLLIRTLSGIIHADSGEAHLLQ